MEFIVASIVIFAAILVPYSKIVKYRYEFSPNTY